MPRTSLTPDSAITRSREILESEVDGEVIALDINRGECYGFNSVGSSVWHLLKDETTVSAICDALSGEFEVEQDECQAEVMRLVNELIDNGLVEVRSA